MVPHAVNPATIFINLIFNKPIYRFWWFWLDLEFKRRGVCKDGWKSQVSPVDGLYDALRVSTLSRQQLTLQLSILGALGSILTPTLAPKMQAGLLGDLDWSGKHQATIRLLRPPEGSSEEHVSMEPRSTSYELSVSLFIGWLKCFLMNDRHISDHIFLKFTKMHMSSLSCYCDPPKHNLDFRMR